MKLLSFSLMLICFNLGSMLAGPSLGPLDEEVKARRAALDLEKVKDLSLALAIPTYREWREGNVKRLLEFFSRVELPCLATKLIFIVNHSPEVARSRGEIWDDNKAALIYLEAIKAGGRNSHDLKVLADRLRQNNVSIEIVDLTKKGFSRNVGHLRHIGFERAVALHTGDLDNLILAPFDADSLPPSQYREELGRVFQNPSNKAAAFFMQFRIPRGSSPLLHATHYSARALYGNNDFTFSLGTSLPPRGGTPRIALRASYFLRLGGFKFLDNGEDLDLLEKMDAHSDIARLWAYPILTADRARSDGYDAGHRFRNLQKIESGEEPLLEDGGSTSIGVLAEAWRSALEEFINLMPLEIADLFRRELDYQEGILKNDALKLHQRLSNGDAGSLEGLKQDSQSLDQNNPWESPANADFWLDSSLYPQYSEAVHSPLFWSEYLTSSADLSLYVKVSLYTNLLARLMSFYREFIQTTLPAHDARKIENIWESRKMMGALSSVATLNKHKGKLAEKPELMRLLVKTFLWPKAMKTYSKFYMTRRFQTDSSVLRRELSFALLQSLDFVLNSEFLRTDSYGPLALGFVTTMRELLNPNEQGDKQNKKLRKWFDKVPHLGHQKLYALFVLGESVLDPSERKAVLDQMIGPSRLSLPPQVRIFFNHLEKLEQNGPKEQDQQAIDCFRAFLDLTIP